MNNKGHEIPNDDTVTAGDIHPGADLSGKNFHEADLSRADLRRSDLSGADLREADLGDVDLREADLSEADLSNAILSESLLRRADLSEATLLGTDLSGADLRMADLSEAFVIETVFSDAILSGGTEITPPDERIREFYAQKGYSDEEQKYDRIARANHELRDAYSGNGLIKQARDARFRERRARRREAKAGDRRGTAAWVGSILSQCFTGYGVRLRYVIGSMLVLYLLSTFVYWNWGDMSWNGSLYYSIVTFTTASPPPQPTGTITSFVAGIETFAGTVAIVFLGYVLGTRERV